MRAIGHAPMGAYWYYPPHAKEGVVYTAQAGFGQALGSVAGPVAGVVGGILGIALGAFIMGGAGYAGYRASKRLLKG